MILQILLHDELRIPVFFIGGIANDSGLQSEQQFPDAIVHVQCGIEAQHFFDLGKRYANVTYIAAKG